jgi:hypothetical protein
MKEALVNLLTESRHLSGDLFESNIIKVKQVPSWRASTFEHVNHSYFRRGS